MTFQVSVITETWLRESIADSVVSIAGYNIYRRDRKNNQHGGVCVYTKENHRFETITDINCCDEILLGRLRPYQLPRGISCIIIAACYLPPSADDSLFLDHLIQSPIQIESRYPNSGLIITGDFNRLNVDSVKSHFKLKQFVKQPTRESAILDLFLTNLDKFYQDASLASPFGLSDHNTVLVRPSKRTRSQPLRKRIITGDMRASCRQSLSR